MRLHDHGAWPGISQYSISHVAFLSRMSHFYLAFFSHLAFLSRISHFYLAFLSHISHFYLTSRIFISHLAFLSRIKLQKCFSSIKSHLECPLQASVPFNIRSLTLYYIQYRSNVSYHFSSCFSRDAYRFSRDVSGFSRESLRHLVWNILYMYYLQNVKNG